MTKVVSKYLDISESSHLFFFICLLSEVFDAICYLFSKADSRGNTYNHNLMFHILLNGLPR